MNPTRRLDRARRKAKFNRVRRRLGRVNPKSVPACPHKTLTRRRARGPCSYDELSPSQANRLPKNPAVSTMDKLAEIGRVIKDYEEGRA